MPRLFGTNGVRGVIGETMTAQLGLDLGRALGTWLVQGGDAGGDTPAGRRPQVVVGHDFRTSASMLTAAVSAGLMTSGCDVLEAGPAPTPAIQYAVKTLPNIAAGVIITASHNPPRFNGIKFCRGDGREMMPDMEDDIEAVYFNNAFHRAAWDEHGQALPLSNVVERYHQGILEQVDVNAIRAAGFTVAVDTANGAGCGSLPLLLRDLGCRVVALNAQPDGTFPGHPSEPTEENAGDLMALVQRTKADLGVIVDGDADRCVFVDENGTYHPGDKSLSIVAANAVKRAGGGIVATPISSSSCVEEHVQAAGGTVHYTVVGSPKVAAAMVETGAVFGGEENGGLIFPGFQFTRDAAMTAAAMLEILAVSGEPLSAHVARVPVKHVVKLKIEVNEEVKGPLFEAVVARLASDAPGGVTVHSVDARDGVKATLDGGWVLVRASGTEPIVRVYAEAADRTVAGARADAYLGWVSSLVAALPAT